MQKNQPGKPLILAPAGNKNAFLAAVAAGTDAVYCGLKRFSARMAAVNFSIPELSALSVLAREHRIKVFVTLNTLAKTSELDSAAECIRQLRDDVRPEAIIVQDPAWLAIADQLEFKGERYLSTLANLSFSKALKQAGEAFNISGVVLPRELSIDEIKSMAAACPAGLKLEVFIHGALCYGVSGRCYWSSYLGGKSSLRGRCVQPCRRRYRLKSERKRYFSCRDFSLDVLAKLLLNIPQITGWKIEGRKKGPHYVYYCVRAYRLLRDHAGDPNAKKDALGLLARALGREGSHYHFLSHRKWNPIDGARQTGSGLKIGTIQGPRSKPFFTPVEALMVGDVLRLGYEDDPGHAVMRVKRAVPKKGRMVVKAAAGGKIQSGRPVFLIDRLEADLRTAIQTLDDGLQAVDTPIRKSHAHPFKRASSRAPFARPWNMRVSRRLSGKRVQENAGIWLSDQALAGLAQTALQRIWWWLPPVIWPENEDQVASQVALLIKKGARRFVLNAPWQTAFFTGAGQMHLWAGPFCNVANPLFIDSLKKMGLAGVIISPELGRDDCLALPPKSSLPLGIVLSGHWPLCISRTKASAMPVDRAFSSPKGEQAWVARYGQDYWVFPNWSLDLRSQREALQRSGYAGFVHLSEPIPKAIGMKQRAGLWNWRLGLQ